MNILLFVPAVILGFPLMMGAWLASVKLYKALATKFSKQTSFVVTLCLGAFVLSLLTAPAWLVGIQGYALCSLISIGFIAYGAPHLFRVMRFIELELDGNPDNDVPLPNDDNKPASK